MNFKTKEELSDDFIESSVMREVEDIEHHYNPTLKYSAEMKEINTISSFVSAAKLLNHHIKKGSRIVNTIDPDVDGFTSTSTLLYLFSLLGEKIDVISDEGKSHGLTENIMSQIIEGDYDLVVVTDAGSNNIEQHKLLQDKGIDLIVIDHHEIEEENVGIINSYNPDHCIIVNNQVLDVNPNYTGVGMTYIFCKLYLYRYGNILSPNEMNGCLDLVALGQIADVSNVADPEIRGMVYHGLENISNLFIKEVMKEKGIEKMTGRDASFSIISMCNAAARIGTVEEKLELIKALTEKREEVYEIEKRKKNKSTGKFEKIKQNISYYGKIVQELVKNKAKQDKIVKNYTSKIHILLDKNIMICEAKGAPAAINGLIAMKLADKHKKPVLVSNDFDKAVVKGSARCPSEMDFKTFLLSSEVMEFCQGHAQAFGWGIKKDKLDDLYDYINCSDTDLSTDIDYYVDKIFNKPEPTEIVRVEVNKGLYGGRVEYPLFAYKEISFHKKCISKRGSMLTLFDNGVTFVMFNTPEEVYDDLIMSLEGNTVRVNVVGEPRVSSFAGKERVEVIIKDIEVVKEIEENKFGIDF